MKAGDRVKVDFISESATIYSGKRFTGYGVLDRVEDGRVFGCLDDGTAMVGAVVVCDGCSQIIQVNRVVSNARIPQTPRVALRTFWSFFHDLTTLFYATIALHQALSIYAIFFD